MKLSIKKTIALFLCLAMIFSFAFTAFAASDEPDANIDVTETVETTTEGCENTDSVTGTLTETEANLPEEPFEPDFEAEETEALEVEETEVIEEVENPETRNPGDQYVVKYSGNSIAFAEGVKIPSYYSYLLGKNTSGLTAESVDRKYICKEGQAAESGKLVYCLEPAQHSYNNDKYTEADQSVAWRKMPQDLRLSIGLAMAYGYPTTDFPTASDDTNGKASGAGKIATEKYYATQIIIWEFIIGYRSTTRPYRLTMEKSPLMYFSNGNYRYGGWKTILSVYNAIDESLRTHSEIPAFCNRYSSDAPTYILEYQAKSNTYCYYFPENLIDYDTRCTTPLPEGIYYMRNADKQVIGFTATKEAAEALPADGLSVKVSNPCPSVDADKCGVAFICENNDHQPFCTAASPDPANGYFRLKIDAPQPVSFSKTDVGGKEIIGAALSLYDENGDLIDSWISAAEPHVVTTLERGKIYVLHEDLAPLGYATASDVEFTVNESGVETQDVYMVDEITTIEISKQDLGGEELSGAELTLFDAEGNVVESWISGAEPHVVTGLHVGETYTLHEDLAPLGYATASDVEFVIEDTGEVQKVAMVDEVTHFEFIKLDENGEHLEGGKFQILDAEGTVIYEWISSAEPFTCEKLGVGQTYAMHEVEAPAGYELAEDVLFIVVDTTEVQTIMMTDAPTMVEISKQDIAGEEIPGADLVVYDSEGNIVDEWTSTEESHIITNLLIGETYTLHEEVCPFGYVTASDVEFTILGDGSVQQVVMIDEITKFQFIKLDEKNQPLAGGVFQILDSEGKVVFEWTSSNDPFTCEGLGVGEIYYMHEVTAPKGYEKAADVKFVVENTAEVQVIKMLDYPVTGDSTNTTTWLIVGGIALAVFAVSMTVYAILRKRETT